METEPIQTNTNHLFTFYQSASKPLTSPRITRMRTQSQQPLRRQTEQSGAVVTQPSEIQSSQLLPGVETNAVPLVSHDSIERARSRRKMRVVAAAVNTSR